MVRWRKEKTCFLLSYWCLERACQQRQKMLNSVVFHLSDEKAPGFLRKRGHISGGKWYTYYISGNEKSPALSSFFQRHWGYKSKYCFRILTESVFGWGWENWHEPFPCLSQHFTSQEYRLLTCRESMWEKNGRGGVKKDWRKDLTAQRKKSEKG